MPSPIRSVPRSTRSSAPTRSSRRPAGRSTAPSSRRTGPRATVLVTQKDDEGNVNISAPFVRMGDLEERMAADIARQVGGEVQLECPQIVEGKKGDTFECEATGDAVLAPRRCWSRRRTTRATCATRSSCSERARHDHYRGGERYPPLLLIHGFTGTWRAWGPLRRAALGAVRRARADLAGHTGGPELPGERDPIEECRRPRGDARRGRLGPSARRRLVDGRAARARARQSAAGRAPSPPSHPAAPTVTTSTRS